MSEFYYQGRNQQGELIQGVLDETSADKVAEQLIKRNIIPVNIRNNIARKKIFKPFSLELTFNRKVSRTALIVFCRQMYSLCKAGIPIASSILRLAETTSQPRLAIALRKLAADLAAGQNLANAMQQHPHIFPKMIISLIQVSIEGASLDVIFLQLSKYLEMEERTEKRIKSVFRYPTFVLIAVMLAIIIINYFVIPPFAKLYASFSAQLPWQTKVLLGISHFMVSYWYFLLLGLMVVCVLVYYLSRKQAVKLWYGKYQLKLPLIGEIIHKILLSRFAKIFSIIIHSGIPITEGISLVADTFNNAFIRSKLLQMKLSLERGTNLLVAAASAEMFTPLALQMLAIGEETGELVAMLDKTSDLYEEELEHSISKLSEQLGVVILVAVAGMVLVLALGVFLPMWDLAKFAH